MMSSLTEQLSGTMPKSERKREKNLIRKVDTRLRDMQWRRIRSALKSSPNVYHHAGRKMKAVCIGSQSMILPSGKHFTDKYDSRTPVEKEYDSMFLEKLDALAKKRGMFVKQVVIENMPMIFVLKFMKRGNDGKVEKA